MIRFSISRRRPAAWLVLVPFLAMASALVVRGQERPEPIAASHSPAIDAIRADSLRGHLSFLASDLLEGRDTPSRGLDIAAEYIASQFRRAGLEPAGDNDYFQEAHWKFLEADPNSFHFTIELGEKRYNLPASRVSLDSSGTLDLQDIGLFKVAANDPESLEELDPELIQGQAVVFDPVESGDGDNSEAELRAALLRLKPALLIELGRESIEGDGLGRGRLIDPEQPEGDSRRVQIGRFAGPQVRVHDPALIEALEAFPAGSIDGSLTLTLGEPVARPVVLKNVAALLRGSDPELRDECVIISAHYDHLGIAGVAEAVDGDRIYNGANDDGSGTVMVIELAETFARQQIKPRRSILFLTFFGEEKGLLGSRYYGRHPIVLLERTVAHLNLEHIGRTDDSEGPQLGRASLTGFDFSEVGEILRDAGRSTDVEVFKHPRNSNAFFSRSDNQALADLGIPAHTLCVAYLFPDYHGVGDHWEKVDYENMARIGRTIALGLLRIADRDEPPRWNADEPLADRYLKAWEALHETER